MHRTFGVLVQGQGLSKQDKMTLQSAGPATQHYVTARTHTGIYEGPDAWAGAILASQDAPLEEARKAHQRWWREFAGRSYIRVAATDTEPTEPRLIKKPRGNFHIGTCQQTKFNLIGSMAYLRLYNTALKPEEIDAGGVEPHSDFDFSQKTTKPGVYIDAQEPTRTARNRGNTSQVTEEGETCVSFNGSSWLAVPNKEGLMPPRAIMVDLRLRPGRQRKMGSRLLDFSTQHTKPQEGIILDTYPGNSLRLITPVGNLQAQGQVLQAGKWQRVTASYDAATGAAAIYLDGKRIAEEKFKPANPSENESNNIQARVEVLSQAYKLQRYMNACAGRGNYPIKFNGSLFTVSGNEMNEMFDPDYRRWGEPYWFQNTRLPYWTMLAAGDFELMKPLFEMYMGDALETAVKLTGSFLTRQPCWLTNL